MPVVAGRLLIRLIAKRLDTEIFALGPGSYLTLSFLGRALIAHHRNRIGKLLPL